MPGNDSISSCSSVNSDEIRDCIKEAAAKLSDRERLTPPYETNSIYEEENCDLNSSKEPETVTNATQKIFRDAATCTECFSDFSETDDNDTTLGNDNVCVSQEILAQKLDSLNKEIDSFRSENASIAVLKRELEVEQNSFRKEKRKLLQEVEDERVRMNFILEEERKKLAKEKMVFERYSWFSLF